MRSVFFSEIYREEHDVFSFTSGKIMFKIYLLKVNFFDKSLLNAEKFNKCHDGNYFL